MGHITSSRYLSLLIVSATLVACGKASHNSFVSPGLPSDQDSGWVAGVFDDQALFKDSCAVPRSGTDKFSGRAYPDIPGTSMDEKMWLRSWSNDTYLWYDEITDRDPLPYPVLEYFDLLRTDFRTASGSFKDNFHFSQSTDEYNARTQSGVIAGYGISWEFKQTFVPRRLVVRYTEPNSPADLAGIERGDVLVKINQIDVINSSAQADIDEINAALFGVSAGQSYNFSIQKLNGEEQIIQLTAGNIELMPVHNVKLLDTDAGRVGYLQFNSHIRPAQEPLIEAVQRFVDDNVTELVLDLRYNSGGLLSLASQMAYMVAGSAQTSGLTFDELHFNAKYPNNDPVTGRLLVPTPFYANKIDYVNGTLTSQSLPSLNLNRIYVLSTDATCSASEAFINGLRGVDVEVVLIGDQTCGKPYGFYPQDNCGTTYFTIQFQGINQKGFGDYVDGFIPTPTPTFEADVLGCPVADDFSQALGEPTEGMLAAALKYMQDESCPPIPAAKSNTQAQYALGPQITRPNPILEAIILEHSQLSHSAPIKPKRD